MKRFLLFVASMLFFLGLGPATPVAAETNPFPRPAELEPDVQFWIRVYTEVSTRGGLLHDSRDLGLVYEVLSFPSGASERTRQRSVESARRRYRQILQSLARGRRSGLSNEERRVLALFPEGVTNATLRAAAGRLRFQLGQADKFRSGLVRSGAWEPHIRKVLGDMGLPIELAALPHVESSYTPHAWSRVGAAGLWQFTRSTGRRYMQVDHVVDERMDPYRASVAAARLLEQNRQTTGSWPLAITAYNHGAAGMRRAVNTLGTRDIATILRKYRSRTFGFASRNFYLEFLAAADVDFHSEKYFGPLLLDTPIEYETFEMPYYTTARGLADALGVPFHVLRDANPALRSPVWQGAKHIPRGFALRIPREQLARPVEVAIAELPSSVRFSRQVPDTTHTVRRGETLSVIAARYGVRARDIVALNGLRSQHRIRAGQKLRLPRHDAPRMAAPVAAQQPPADGLYTVRRGDTLSRIASRFSLGERELMELNGLRNRNRIYAGQVLRVDYSPGATAASPITPPAPTPASAPAPEPAPKAVREPPTPEIARAPDPHPEVLALLSEPDPAESPEPEPVVTSSESPGVGAEPELPAEAEASAESAVLVADPSDYSVSSSGRIEVQAAETLGHYADWLEIKTHQLRALNGLRYSDPLVIGARIRLDFSAVEPALFEQRRLAYHRDLQEEFFAQWEIAGTTEHVLERGDSLWELSRRRYRVPIWLLRQYNPDLDFGALSAGARVTVPVLQPHVGGAEDVESSETPRAEAHRGDLVRRNRAPG